mmetsp:Transcript_34711/g.53268  ORF Transcript_34711/g.53268 Transcript_34711/m.53268 type:complete len:92 (+) Transcript_34711:3204-3479(+)
MVNKDIKILKTFVIQIAEALDLLSEFKLVHADLRPENILLSLDKQHSKIEMVKVVDYGSSFRMEEEVRVTCRAPEYLPPELLAYKAALNKI